MKADVPRRLEGQVSNVLFYGCVFSAALLVFGLTLYAMEDNMAASACMAGLAVLMMTPVLRTLLLARGYWRRRERGFALLAFAVALFIIFSAR